MFITAICQAGFRLQFDQAAHGGYKRRMFARRQLPITRHWLAVLTLVACAALWSLNGPLIKLLSHDGVPGVTIACYRSLLGGLVFAPFALRRLGTLRNVAPAWPIAGVLTFTLMTAAFVIANTLTAAANAIILQYTSPIWVFVLSPLLLKERPGRDEGLVLLIAMVGVLVIFSGNPDTNATGLIVALVSGLGYGSLIVVLRGLRRVSPTVVAALNTLGSGLLLVLPVAVWATFGLTASQWGLMLLLALVQFTLPYVMFSWALRHVEAHRAALIVLLETVLNPLWTYLIVGEAPPPATLLGGPLILVGVAGWLVLAWRREATLRPPQPSPESS
jgi:DME family drug/metabolite transporter